MPSSLGSPSIDPTHVSKNEKDNTMPNTIENNETTNTYKAALEARRERLAAMSEEQIARRLRLDVATTCTLAVTAVQNVAELRGELVAQFGENAAQLLDGLEVTARAARQADVEHEGRDEGVELAQLHKELVAMHERLLADADSLAVRGFLSRERIAGFRDARSYQGALRSVVGLVSVLREQWSSLASRTPITAADLAAADDAALRFEAALAKGPQANGRVAALETRTRALSLLVHEYEQLRRMVGFLRYFENDADRYVPSLYAGRGGRKPTKGGEEDLDTDVPVTPITGPVPNNGGPAFTS